MSTRRERLDAANQYMSELEAARRALLEAASALDRAATPLAAMELPVYEGVRQHNLKGLDETLVAFAERCRRSSVTLARSRIEVDEEGVVSRAPPRKRRG